MVERFREDVTCPFACQAEGVNFCLKDAGGYRRIPSCVLASTVGEAVLPQ